MAKYNDFLITKEATKYWKKAIKKDRVMIAEHEGDIYIVNGYNAFKFPAAPYIWDEIARPAFMCDMPTEGKAVEYRNGKTVPGFTPDIVKIFNRNKETITTAAERTPFTMDFKSVHETEQKTLRIFKNGNGDITTVNSVYDALVDFSHAEKIYCNGKVSPVYIENELGFAALLLPVRHPDAMPEIIRGTFAGLLGGE